MVNLRNQNSLSKVNIVAICVSNIIFLNIYIYILLFQLKDTNSCKIGILFHVTMYGISGYFV